MPHTRRARGEGDRTAGVKNSSGVHWIATHIGDVSSEEQARGQVTLSSAQYRLRVEFRPRTPVQKKVQL
jgi:hypothetical protein